MVQILTNISEIIMSPLIHIFNLSIKNSIFPDYFKVVVIKLLFNGGNCKTMSNYRPNFMLTNLDKMFVKIIKTRLIFYLEHNNLLSKNQYGFVLGLDTENA
jgi:hypothetical protein